MHLTRTKSAFYIFKSKKEVNNVASHWAGFFHAITKEVSIWQMTN